MSYKTKLRISCAVALLGGLILLVNVLQGRSRFSHVATVGILVSLIGEVSALAVKFEGWLSGDSGPDHAPKNAQQLSPRN